MKYIGASCAHHPGLLAVVVMSGSLLWGGASHAGETVPAPGAGFNALERLDSETLEASRGKEGLVPLTQVQSIQVQQASVEDSSFAVINGDMITGDVNIDAGALKSYSGTGVFNITTGNGNATNGGIGISVYMMSPSQ